MIEAALATVRVEKELQGVGSLSSAANTLLVNTKELLLDAGDVSAHPFLSEVGTTVDDLLAELGHFQDTGAKTYNDVIGVVKKVLTLGLVEGDLESCFRQYGVERRGINWVIEYGGLFPTEPEMVDELHAALWTLAGLIDRTSMLLYAVDNTGARTTYQVPRSVTSYVRIKVPTSCRVHCALATGAINPE